MLSRFSAKRFFCVVTCSLLLVVCSLSSVFADVTEDISVTGTVPANASNFPTSLISITPGNTFAQNTPIDYQITYGSTLSNTTPITLIANWSQGTIQGAGSPSVDVLTYVSGSASTAYGGTPPVIDTTNRTITWTIPSFPANTTGQIVTFSLKTTSNYTGSTPVDFSVSAHAESTGVVTADSTVNQTYLFDSSLEPTNTPTPAATDTPIPGPTATPGPGPTVTPTPVSSPLRITDVGIRSVSSSSATIAVTTSEKTTITVRYGTGTNALDQTLTDLSSATGHVFTLSGLTADTRYYFQITVTDTAGKKVTSDLYTFLTAKKSNAPTADPISIVMASGNTILYAFDPQKANQTPLAVMPFNTTFTFRVRVLDDVKILSVISVVRDQHILASNTFTKDDTTENALTEFEPNFFTGTFQAPNTPLSGILFVRVKDANNNITEVKVADLRIVRPLSVVEKGNGNPIEHAKVTLSVFNETTHAYRFISPDVLPIQNPAYSKPDGMLELLALPLGRYRAVVTALGFRDRTVDFTIGENPTENYSRVEMERQSFSFFTTVKYLAGILMDTASLTGQYIQSLSTSNRFFDLLAFTILFCFILLTFISFGLRLELALTFLPWFVWFRIRSLFSTAEKSTAIAGRVIEKQSDRPIIHANVYVISALGNKLLAHTKTNRFGQFLLGVKTCKEYVIKVEKVGFVNPPSQTFRKETMTSGTLILSLTKRMDRTHPSFDLLLEVLGALIGFSFEVLLGASMLLEIALGNTLGWIRVLPFLLLSCVNLCFWLFHMRQLKQHHYVM